MAMQQLYAVILKDFKDSDTFYDDMETPGGSITIPDRQVEVDMRKPISRVTIYSLTPQEADLVKQDDRVEDVEIYDKDFPIELLGNYRRYRFQQPTDNNWGRFQHIHQDQPVPATSDIITLPELPYTGKNVDVVIMDDMGWEPNHPEFLDENGNTRVIDYNWFQHARELGDITKFDDVIYHPTVDNFHNIHVAGTVAGRNEGWATDANIYFLPMRFGSNNPSATVSIDLAFDYIRLFHRNKPVNPETGRKNPTIVNASWGASVGWMFGMNPKSISSINFRGQNYLPSDLFTVYDGYYGPATADTTLVGLPTGSNPINSTFKYITSDATPTTSTVDRLVSVPPEFEKSINFGASFTLDDPGNSNKEITVNTPCDLKSYSTLRAKIVNYDSVDDTASVSSITIRRIINNSGQIVTTFPFVDGQISVDLRGLTRFSQMSASGNIPVRYMVEVDLRNGDIAEYEVDWNFRTHEYGTQVLNENEINDLTYDEPTAHTVSSTSANATVEEITHTPLLDFTDESNLFVGSAYSGPKKATIDTPWPISYLGQDYNTIGVSSYSFMTFGFSTGYGGTPDTPGVPKLLLGSASLINTGSSFTSGANRYGSDCKTKTLGVAPNRTFVVHYRGWQTLFSMIYRPTEHLDWQCTFYENEPGRIDVAYGNNPLDYQDGGFSEEEIHNFQFNLRGYSFKNSAYDADCVDLMNDGILFVAAAGNSNAGIFNPGDIDYDNAYLNSSATSYTYYNRAGSPHSAGGNSDTRAITVGSLDIDLQTATLNRRSGFSNWGSNIDVWAAGSYVQSAWPNDNDRDDTSVRDGFKYRKISGTSMASPQVCGILACMLEKYPDMSQKQAIRLLQSIMVSNDGVYDEPIDGNIEKNITGSVNKTLMYPNLEKPKDKPAYPKPHMGRPKSGAVYPRAIIKRRK
jgi:hypothetical protein